ncbi:MULTISPECIES: hypothetical protein [Marinobacter]|uniref:Uncharacterized protein n=1 Tax=Marinobacter profundi TaxID=2666256 RepID=A0A2G1UH13_9GAMM|nr:MULTISPECIES: hypothetical protein [Marinobacter]MBD3657273.1 hypothetical protein [Marinobacter sp.]PHQ13786.1 hypothetical protein CLH61_16875 [Marinobacter profundi]
MNRVLSVLLAGALLAGPLAAMAQPPHSQGLPPGLHKKVARGGELPPGWQKKLDYRRGDYFDHDLLRYGRVRDIDHRHQRVEIEDKVYTIVRGTREIVDILKH